MTMKCKKRSRPSFAQQVTFAIFIILNIMSCSARPNNHKTSLTLSRFKRDAKYSNTGSSTDNTTSNSSATGITTSTSIVREFVSTTYSNNSSSDLILEATTSGFPNIIKSVSLTTTVENGLLPVERVRETKNLKTINITAEDTFNKAETEAEFEDTPVTDEIMADSDQPMPDNISYDVPIGLSEEYDYDYLNETGEYTGTPKTYTEIIRPTKIILDGIQVVADMNPYIEHSTVPRIDSATTEVRISSIEYSTPSPIQKSSSSNIRIEKSSPSSSYRSYGNFKLIIISVISFSCFSGSRF